MAAGQKRKRRAWPVWVAVVVVLLVGGQFVRSRMAGGPGGPGGGSDTGVQTAKAEITTQQQKIAASGVVASQTGTQVKIGSQITGRIAELPADVGTHVKAGQVVAVLDSPDYKAQVDMQRQAVASSVASLAQAKSRFEQASETAGYTREQTAAQIAQADAAMQAAQSQIDSSAATARLQPTQTATEIRRAEATLSTAKSSLTQAQVTARQQVQQSQSSVDDAQVALDNASRTLQRKQKLLKEGFVAAQEVDDAETAARQADAKLASAKASLEITREKVRADVQTAQDTVAQAQASLESAQAGKLQDAVRQAELQSARQSLAQSAAALKLRFADRRQDRIKVMAVKEAANAVAQSQASLLQARAQLSYQEAQFAKAVVRSPIDGTVLSITAQQGETVAAGLSAPTLITVADLTKLEVRAYVDETDIGKTKIGLPAEVRVEAFPGKVFKGKVTKIASASTVKDNVVTYETTVAVENPEGLLRPDMTADVTLILGEYPNVLTVPSESIHREVSRTLVYVLHPEKEGQDKVETRPVELGFDDGAHTGIKSGLKEGETVVVAGLPRLGVRAPDAQRGEPGR